MIDADIVGESLAPALPDVWIRYPPGFRHLPLVDSDADWDGRAEEFLAMMPGDRPDEVRVSALAQLRSYATLLRSGRVIDALCFLGVAASGQSLTTASLMVSLLPMPGTDAVEVVAQGLLDALSEQHPEREIYAIELPVGPAVASFAQRRLEGTSADGNGYDLHIRALEVSIPVPGQDWLLVLALSSPTDGDWDHYQEVMAAVCRSVRTSAPGQGS